MTYPEVGKIYTDYRGATRRVSKVTAVMVEYYLANKPLPNSRSLQSFMATCMRENDRDKVMLHFREKRVKPLDQAFKELDKQFCRHANVRKDYFFSAMVYLTCKDCDKPLN